MKKRVYLATVESNSTVGRVILAADYVTNEDGNRWVIIALLHDGTESETYVDTLPNGTLDDAVQLVAKAWRDDVWDLQWLPAEGSLENVEDEK